MCLNVLLTIQTTLYFVAFFLSLFVSIPLGITKGKCLLYSTIDYNEDSDAFVMNAGPVSNCNYCIGMTVLTMIVALILGAIHFLRIMYLRRGDSEEFLAFLNIVIVPAAFVVAFLLFIAGCIVSVGYDTFCKELHDIKGISKCSDIEYVKWDTSKISSKGFIGRLEMAETCAWLAFLVWTGISAIYTFQICRKGWRTVLLNQKSSASEGRAGGTPSENPEYTSNGPKY